MKSYFFIYLTPIRAIYTTLTTKGMCDEEDVITKFVF